MMSTVAQQRIQPQQLRIALVTTEFVTDTPTGGGLASYLNRISQALRDLGHRVEVFVAGPFTAETFDYDGVLVHRVPSSTGGVAFRSARTLCRIAGRRREPWLRLVDLLASAAALGKAVRLKEAQRPFDFVQSADFRAAGLFVSHSLRRPHLVRCSMASDLWAEAANKRSWSSRATASLERASMRRADACYAPSAFVAHHYRDRFKIPVDVVRPPVFIEQQPAKHAGVELPPRFLVHFGQLGTRKGTDTLAAALPLAWREEPTLTMVWAGRVTRPVQFHQWKVAWGAHASRVQSLGPLPRPELFAVLRRAEAAVLPSLADNLPNTVIESLMFGLPVIGSQGASIDELVEDGRTGTLVPLNAPHDLARAMVEAWRGTAPWSSKPIPTPAIFAEMEPRQAAQNLIALASSQQRCDTTLGFTKGKLWKRGAAHA